MPMLRKMRTNPIARVIVLNVVSLDCPNIPGKS